MSAGLFGLLDFTALPTGQAFVPPTPPAPPGPAGFFGFLGFPFIPVGQGTGAIFGVFGHAPKVGGKPPYGYYIHLLRQLRIQRLRRMELARRKKKESPTPPMSVLVDKVIRTAQEKDERSRQRVAAGQMYAVLLAEL